MILSPIVLSAETAATARRAALAANPGATIDEQFLAKVTSEALPTLNGHRVVFLRLGNMPLEPLSGPIGSSPGLGRVQCAVTAYDADTGDFLVQMEHLSVAR